MTVRLRLFVAGETSRSTRAIGNLRALCDELVGDDYDLEIIDVIDHPELAEDARVLATPTVLKLEPPPIRRAIGDLSDLERLAQVLDLGGTQTTDRTPKA